MKILRAVAGRDACPERGVGVHALARGAARQHLEHDFEVLKTGQDFFDAGEGDHGAGQGEAHAAVAFGFDHGDGAGLSDEEVGAADGGGDGEELVAQIGARGGGEGFRIIGEGFSLIFGETHAAGEDFADLAAIDVERGGDDVGGLVFAELDDELGKIGFEDSDAGGLEEGIELDLGRGHGLDLDDLGGILLFQEIEDDLACFSGIGGPVDLAAGGGATGFELLEVEAQVFEGVGAEVGGGGTELLPGGFFGDEFGAVGLDDVGGVGYVFAQLGIAQHGQGGLGKGRREGWIELGVEAHSGLRSK